MAVSAGGGTGRDAAPAPWRVGRAAAGRALARRALAAAALAAAGAAYLQAALSHAIYNWKAHSGDQNSYLRLALRIREGEGFANGNFHPLVAMLFSPVASREWGFFTQAKLIDIAIGAAVLGVVFALGRRLFGTGAALAATGALALCAELTARAARSEPEVLLTGLVFAAWACWVLGRRRPRWALAAGALAGLAYLTKGTGQFLLVGFIVLPALRDGPVGAWARRGTVGAMVAAYMVAASPLLVTNWRAFGSPFYAFPSAHAMWYDEWDDRLGSPDGRHITLRTYAATHRPADAAARVADGLREVPPEWAGAFRVALHAGAGWAIAAGGLAAAIGAAAGRRRRPGPAGPGGAGAAASGAAIPAFPGAATTPGAGGAAAPPGGGDGRIADAAWALAVVAVPMFGFFVWYAPIANSARFVLPLVPIVFTVSAGALAALARRRLPGVSAAAGALAVVPVVVLTIAALALRAGEWRRPADVAASDRDLNARAIALLAYLGRTAPPGGEETVLWGPGDLATWTLHGQVTFKPVLETVADFAALDAYRAALGARRVILAPEMIEERPEALGRHFRVSDDRVVWDALPPGWRLAYQVPDDGCRYCVFEASDLDHRRGVGRAVGRLADGIPALRQRGTQEAPDGQLAVARDERAGHHEDDVALAQGAGRHRGRRRIALGPRELIPGLRAWWRGSSLLRDVPMTAGGVVERVVGAQAGDARRDDDEDEHPLQPRRRVVESEVHATRPHGQRFRGQSSQGRGPHRGWPDGARRPRSRRTGPRQRATGRRLRLARHLRPVGGRPGGPRRQPGRPRTASRRRAARIGTRPCCSARRPGARTRAASASGASSRCSCATRRGVVPLSAWRRTRACSAGPTAPHPERIPA